MIQSFLDQLESNGSIAIAPTSVAMASVYCLISRIWEKKYFMLV